MQPTPNKRATTELPESLKSVVSGLPALKGHGIIGHHLDRRGAGVWRIAGREGDFAIRFRSPDHTNSVRDEFKRMQLAATAAVAPEPIAFDDQQGWIVTRWADGRPISSRRRPTDSELDYVAAICARLHTLEPFDGKPADPSASLETPLGRLGTGSAILPEGFSVWCDRALTLSRQLSATSRLLPCHNDLYPGNIVIGGDGVTLIDWEYAANNDPACDLAGFAVCASLGIEDVEPLMSKYLQALAALDSGGTYRSETSLSRVRGWMIVNAVSWLPWALADNTMPPPAKAAWTTWARLRYENITTATTGKHCDEIIANCS